MVPLITFITIQLILIPNLRVCLFFPDKKKSKNKQYKCVLRMRSPYRVWGVLCNCATITMKRNRKKKPQAFQCWGTLIHFDSNASFHLHIHHEWMLLIILLILLLPFRTRKGRYWHHHHHNIRLCMPTKTVSEKCM